MFARLHASAQCPRVTLDADVRDALVRSPIWVLLGAIHNELHDADQLN